MKVYRKYENGYVIFMNSKVNIDEMFLFINMKIFVQNYYHVIQDYESFCSEILPPTS